MKGSPYSQQPPKQYTCCTLDQSALGRIRCEHRFLRLARGYNDAAGFLLSSRIKRDSAPSSPVWFHTESYTTLCTAAVAKRGQGTGL